MSPLVPEEDSAELAFEVMTLAVEITKLDRVGGNQPAKYISLFEKLRRAYITHNFCKLFLRDLLSVEQ